MDKMEMKMSVLIQMVNIHRNAKMIGNYDSNKPQLYTEKIAGNVFGCMGFVKEKSGIYVPNTILKEDIRDITETPNRVLAILRKDVKQKEYEEVTYNAKDVKIDLSAINAELQQGKKKARERKPLTEQLNEARTQSDQRKPAHQVQGKKKNDYTR